MLANAGFFWQKSFLVRNERLLLKGQVAKQYSFNDI